jgi:hypothetical protein
MKGAINGSVNLQKDLGAYMTAKMRGDETLFDRYVDGTYDSSADYWKLIKDENGEYGFEWDGNLNIYGENGDRNDANAGLILDYIDLATTGINKGLTLANGDTISADKLREINNYNIMMWASDSDNVSLAGKYLFEDGFMSFEEALDISGKIKGRPLPFVNMIEHYSVRYIMNENDDILRDLMQDGIAKWTDIDDRAKAENGNKSYYKGFGDGKKEITITGKARLLKESESIFHGEGAFKWVFEGGQELVINTAGKFETSAGYLGTYNFGGPDGPLHGLLDVAPYILWGNSPDDKTPIPNRIGLTQIAQRIASDMYNTYQKNAKDTYNAYKYYNSPDYMMYLMNLWPY